VLAWVQKIKDFQGPKESNSSLQHKVKRRTRGSPRYSREGEMASTAEAKNPGRERERVSLLIGPLNPIKT